MSPTQKRRRELETRLRTFDTRRDELVLKDDLPAAEVTELRAIGTDRAAVCAQLDALPEEAKPEPSAVVTADRAGKDRRELRAKASVGRFLVAAMRGGNLTGPERELADECGLESGQIPLELWDVETPAERRAIAQVPGTVGVNLDRLRPAVFANAVLPRLGVEMPRVASGSFVSGTITTSLAAEAKARSAATTATAAAFTTTTSTPKRISARLEIAIEDVAAVGQSNFEAILRQNLSLVLSDALDNAGLNGSGSSNEISGLFAGLTDPSPGAANLSVFDDFAAAHAGGVDGLWSSTIADVGVLVGPATYALAAKTFQTATNYKGELSAAAYAAMNTGGFWTSKRMPAAATFDSKTNNQQAILYRMGPVNDGRQSWHSHGGMSDLEHDQH